MAEYRIMKERVEQLSKKIADDRLREMFLNCFYSTLNTTTEITDDGTTFVFTGDIPAMWLRDSSVQVMGYLPFADCDDDVRRLIKGLIQRQCRYITHDPYSNAFNKRADGGGHQSDETDFMSPWIWERKYEVDSLCYPLWLVMKYYAATGDDSVYSQEFFQAAKRIVEVFTTEQRHDELSPYRHYREGERYARAKGQSSVAGYTGMTWSGYRPSDDACTYGYLIPANQFAVVVLGNLAEVFEKFYADAALSGAARKLRGEIEDGIKKYGIVEHEKYGKIYAYEVDGNGGYNLMDDANVPSLLSLPYLGYADMDDEIYLNTRRFILSRDNPYYFAGKYASGVGSPHTPENYVWHIGIIIRLLTSADKAERKKCYDTLLRTDAGCGVMHESFDADDPSKFTREWFAWANTLFAIATAEMLPELNANKAREEIYEKSDSIRAGGSAAI